MCPLTGCWAARMIRRCKCDTPINIVAATFTASVIPPRGKPTLSRCGGTGKRCVSAARQKINDKRAAVQFEQLLASNFCPGDMVVTLTYRDANLPPTLDQAKKSVKKFLTMLRQSYRLAGQELKYLLVHEGQHGDHRLHHHIVLNAIPDIHETVRSHWAAWGDNLDFASIDMKGYTAWAKYLCKELLTTGRLAPGRHAWSASRNLSAPVVEQGECPDHMAISPAARVGDTGK